MDQISLPA